MKEELETMGYYLLISLSGASSAVSKLHETTIPLLAALQCLVAVIESVIRFQFSLWKQQTNPYSMQYFLNSRSQKISASAGDFQDIILKKHQYEPRSGLRLSPTKMIAVVVCFSQART
jgi:hypothetical protein